MNAPLPRKTALPHQIGPHQTPADVAEPLPSDSAPDLPIARQSRIALKLQTMRFEEPSLNRALLQLVTSVGLFLASCVAMYLIYPFSYWLTLLMAVPTGALLLRVFVVQHDCGHGSFFASRRANDIIGFACGILTLTPYACWRRHHAVHHGNWNNLDRRPPTADIYSTCLTVQEYRALSTWGRFMCRLRYHPLIANLVLPPLIFVFLNRIPFDTPRNWVRERWMVQGTNLAIATAILGVGFLVGFRQVLLVHLPIVVEASIIGVWLFTLQHRFDGGTWVRQGEWSLVGASLEGSSYLRLPRLLQWFTGNIGYHHVHHLAPRIPNYHLEACHHAVETLRAVQPITIRASLRGICRPLWDEDRGCLVGFGDLTRSQGTGPVH
jgi:acyl-lipid omega-6 desaturase (Delta-12 desaturase)